MHNLCMALPRVCVCVCKQLRSSLLQWVSMQTHEKTEDAKNIDGRQNHEHCVLWERGVENGLCCWWSSKRWRGGGGVGGINTVMESEWEGVRGGRSREMIPLSNPLDTRSVWLPTGSERETEAGGGRKQRERERERERNQVGRKKQDEGERRKESCLS